MTRILLDTHAFLWYIDGSPQLTTSARQLIERPDSERLISVACIWEMAVKISIGRLESDGQFAANVGRMLEHNRIELLQPTLDDLDLVSTLPFHHRDPFDRLIVAQTISQSIPVISGDRIFDAYGVDRRW